MGASKEVQDLNALARDYKAGKFPNFPTHYIPTGRLKDSSANELTKACLAFFKINGFFATRVSTTGLMRDGVWTKGNTRKGMSDLVAVVNGLAVFTEIKYGRDFQNASQKQVQKEVEQSGGIYLIARTYADFERQMLAVIHSQHQKEKG